MAENEVRMEMTACPQNERFARLAAAGFIVDLNPTLVELEDVKTAVSEAVTNAVIHGYGIYREEKSEGKEQSDRKDLEKEDMEKDVEKKDLKKEDMEKKDVGKKDLERKDLERKNLKKENLKGRENKVFMVLRKEEKDLTVIIEDYGKGIADVEKAMEPMYTTRPEWERSGMGFAFMEAFMDSLVVESEIGVGTKVTMKKRIFSEDRELFDD